MIELFPDPTIPSSHIIGALPRASSAMRESPAASGFGFSKLL